MAEDAKRFFGTLLSLVLIISAGCDNDPLGRQPVEGHVALDGEPLPDGDLALRPVGRGPSAGARIQNGRYRIAREHGPLPGSYQVLITSYQETGRQITLPNYPNEKIAETRQIIPARFNELSELKMEVTGGGTNKFDFELNSK